MLLVWRCCHMHPRESRGLCCSGFSVVPRERAQLREYHEEHECERQCFAHAHILARWHSFCAELCHALTALVLFHHLRLCRPTAPASWCRRRHAVHSAACTTTVSRAQIRRAAAGALIAANASAVRCQEDAKKHSDGLWGEAGCHAHVECGLLSNAVFSSRCWCGLVLEQVLTSPLTLY